MGKAARKFFHRAPRYTLRAEDNGLLRFVSSRTKNEPLTTEILNISESGLVFQTERKFAPQVGELIKVEIPTEETKTIAWFARVVRLEMPEDIHSWTQHSTMVRVAVRYEALPQAHSEDLRHQLRAKFEQLVHEHRLRQLRQIRAWVLRHSLKLVIYAAAILTTLIVLYVLSQPIGNYDLNSRGIWGERFR